MSSSTISTQEPSESVEKNDSSKPTNEEPEGAVPEESKMEIIFPWQIKFSELCRAQVGSKCMKMLENLLTVYVQKVSKTVQDCYMKPNRAAKLKKCMGEAFVFYHLYYQEIKESFENSTYLEKMTELMAMYLDIEIKASKRRKECCKKIVCRLTSALNVFLDHSENHILDAIIRAKFINKNYREICSPVLGKLLTSLRVYPMNDTLYVRYLLVFKLWKKVVADADERKNINKIAIQNLPAPSNFMDRYKRFNNVLPRVPNSMNVTTFYMQAKFNLKGACQAFMKISKDPQQPIIVDKPLFFEGRLGSSQSSFTGKITSFECGVSRTLMNDIWSIAEPASTKKADGKGDGSSKKKPKDKSNKSGKKKGKALLEKKKNDKNKEVSDDCKEKGLPTTVVSPSDLESNVVPAAGVTAASATVAAREPVVVLKPGIVATEVEQSTTPAEVKPNLVAETQPATVDVIPAPVVNSVQQQEANIKACISSFQELPFDSQASPAEVKPSINLLSPTVKPEIINVPSPTTEDRKPVINRDVEMPHTLPIGTPIICLTPPLEDIAKKEVPTPDGYGIYCRKFSNTTAVCSNLSDQQEETPTLNPLPQQEVVEEPAASSVVQAMEVTEIVKPRDLNELMEVKTTCMEVASPELTPDFLDHEQDVLHEVTIASSELDISGVDNVGELPVYLQCQKEVVVETAENPSPVDSVDSCYIEEENVAEVMEVQSVIIPPSSSAQPKSSFVSPSHSSEVVHLGTGQSPNNRDNYRYVVEFPPSVREQPVFVKPRDVKPESQPPSDEFTKGTLSLDEEIYRGWSYNLFPGSNHSDILLEFIDMEDTPINPAVNPHVINSQPVETSQGANSSGIKRRTSEECSQYPQMCLESNLHNTRGIEALLPTQEYVGEEFSPFTSPTEQYSYYNISELYDNYNSTPFFEESASQASGGNLNQKPITTNGPPYGTVDYSSSSVSSANNSIVLSTGSEKDMSRHAKGMRIPNNSDNNYYRGAEPHKTEEEPLRENYELSNNGKIRQQNSYRKTPQPTPLSEDTRGYSSETGDTSNRKAPLCDESAAPYRGGCKRFKHDVFLGSTSNDNEGLEFIVTQRAGRDEDKNSKNKRNSNKRPVTRSMTKENNTQERGELDSHSRRKSRNPR